MTLLKCVKCQRTTQFTWTLTSEPLCRRHFLKRFYDNIKVLLSSPVLTPTSTIKIVFNGSLASKVLLHAICEIEKPFPSVRIVVLKEEGLDVDPLPRDRILLEEENIPKLPSELFEMMEQIFIKYVLPLKKSELVLLPLTIEEYAAALIYLFLNKKYNTLKYMVAHPKLRFPLAGLFLNDIINYAKIMGISSKKYFTVERKGLFKWILYLLEKSFETSPTSLHSIRSFFENIFTESTFSNYA